MSHRLDKTRIFRIAAVDGKTAAQTTIWTPTADSILVALVFVPRTVTGLVSASTVTVGTAGAGWNQIVTALVLGSVADVALPATILAAGVLCLAGTAVKVNVSVVAVGTAYTFDVYAVAASV